MRAVLEGVAFGLRDCFELVRAHGGAPTRARVSGGGSREELWLSILAAVLDLPLERTAVDAGAAYGAALLGGVAAGVFADPREAVAACVRATETVEPDPALTRAYAGLRPSFVYPALPTRALRALRPLPRATPERPLYAPSNSSTIS